MSGPGRGGARGTCPRRRPSPRHPVTVRPCARLLKLPPMSVRRLDSWSHKRKAGPFFPSLRFYGHVGTLGGILAGSVTFWSLLSNETAPRPVWNSASRLSPNCPLSLAGLVWEGPGLPPHRGSGQGPEGVGSSVLVATANVTAGSRHGASVVTRSWLSPCHPPSSHRGWAPAPAPDGRRQQCLPLPPTTAAQTGGDRPPRPRSGPLRPARSAEEPLAQGSPPSAC